MRVSAMDACWNVNFLSNHFQLHGVTSFFWEATQVAPLKFDDDFIEHVTSNFNFIGQFCRKYEVTGYN